jgi:hypothetical protein
VPCSNLRSHWLSFYHMWKESTRFFRLLQTSGTVSRLCHDRFLPVTFKLATHQHCITRRYHFLKYLVTKQTPKKETVWWHETASKKEITLWAYYHFNGVHVLFWWAGVAQSVKWLWKPNSSHLLQGEYLFFVTGHVTGIECSFPARTVPGQ